ncbi:MAG: hypothetical protein VX910_05435 [Candidatus Latescibacterota bacterium]|nr:hypothetical protein [Candidatus Latescibacterota bacterium]
MTDSFTGQAVLDPRSIVPEDCPNIALAISDQHNEKMVGNAGSTITQTPNVDRFAKEDVGMTNTY